MGWSRKCPTKAFGVEQGWAPYCLRQARYQALGEDIATYCLRQHGRLRRRLDLLDVGVYDGVSRRYIEAYRGSEFVKYHGVDRFPRGKEFVYKSRDWTLHHIDLEGGMPQLESDRYDVVICEQVLEHLDNVENALADLARVLAPGGLLIVGVPTFPPGLGLVRRHVVPITDRVFQVKKKRSHKQAFSKRGLLRLMERTCQNLEVLDVRGFRIVSGGLLRALEYRRWWWRFNRRLGALLPSLCIEIQVLATKTGPSARGTGVSPVLRLSSASTGTMPVALGRGNG